MDSSAGTPRLPRTARGLLAVGRVGARLGAGKLTGRTLAAGAPAAGRLLCGLVAHRDHPAGSLARLVRTRSRIGAALLRGAGGSVRIVAVRAADVHLRSLLQLVLTV